MAGNSFGVSCDPEWLGISRCRNPNCGPEPSHMQNECRAPWPEGLCKKCGGTTAGKCVTDPLGKNLCDSCYKMLKQIHDDLYEQFAQMGAQ